MSIYVIYARKSSEDEERQMLSIQAQIAELRELADKRGVSVGHIFEEAQSARKPGRPVFREMLKLVERKKVAGILCWKPDRLARNMMEGGELIDALDRRLLTEILIPGKAFRNTSDDKFLLGLEFGMSKKYVDDLSDNIKRGNRAVVQSGRVTGMVPLGYLKDVPIDRMRGCGAGKTLVDPERFPLVQEMFRRYLTGAWTVSELRRFTRDRLGLRVREKSTRPAGAISVSHIYSMLRNPFYAGLIKHNGDLHPGGHTPVVSQAEFDHVQALLRRTNSRRPARHEFTFAGLIRCASCGRMVTGEEHWNRRYGYCYIYYRCSRRRVEDRVCNEPYITAVELESQVVAALTTLAVPKQFLLWAKAHLENEALQSQLLTNTTWEGTKKQLATKEAELEGLALMCAKGLLDDQEFAGAKRKAIVERDSLRAALDAAAPSCSTLVQDIELLEVGAASAAVFAQGDTMARRELMLRTCDSLRLSNRRLEISFHGPLNLLTRAAIETSHEEETRTTLQSAEKARK